MPGHAPCASGAVPFKQHRLTGNAVWPAGQMSPAAWHTPSSPIWPAGVQVPHIVQKFGPGPPPQAICAGLGTHVALLHNQPVVATPGGAVTLLKPAGQFFSGDCGHLLQNKLFGMHPGIFVAGMPFQQVPTNAPAGAAPGANPCQHSRPAAPFGHIG